MSRTSSSSQVPDFIIIGAMKSATTTLYEQLVAQPGIFMPELKEPNYFSDDVQYSRGKAWYLGLFDGARSGDLLGEASTHYTKLPTYPDTVNRMYEQVAAPRLIYVMRHPVQRLISQYIHEWTEGNVSVDIDRAIQTHDELIAYSRYAYQLEPYLEKYGHNHVLPVFFESLKKSPQVELERICRFIGYTQRPVWNTELRPSNVSKERIRRFPLYDLLIESPPARVIRRALIPRFVRNRVKRRLQMQERPVLSEKSQALLEETFDRDLARLGAWFGVELNCKNYHEVVTQTRLEWRIGE